MQTRTVRVPQVPNVDGARIVGDATSPTAVWRAAIEQRRELKNQLDELHSERSTISDQLQEPMVQGADRHGLEQRIVDVDARIAGVDKQLADANQKVAATASIPGAVVPEPEHVRQGPPDEVYVMGALFIVLILFPLTIGLVRRMWKRGAAAVSALPQELMDRLSRLDQSVDSIAVEVERIGEGQRFVTRLMAERGQPVEALPAASSAPARRE